MIRVEVSCKRRRPLGAKARIAVMPPGFLFLQYRRGNGRRLSSLTIRTAIQVRLSRPRVQIIAAAAARGGLLCGCLFKRPRHSLRSMYERLNGTCPVGQMRRRAPCKREMTRFDSMDRAPHTSAGGRRRRDYESRTGRSTRHGGTNYGSALRDWRPQVAVTHPASAYERSTRSRTTKLLATRA